MFASFALASLFPCSSVFSQDGLPLFRNMQGAMDGADRIAAVRDFEQEVRAESWNGNTDQSIGEVRKRTRWIGPNYLRVDQVGPGSTYVLYRDGTAGWRGTDDRRLPVGVSKALPFPAILSADRGPRRGRRSVDTARPER
jgi:hypothetical protein